MASTERLREWNEVVDGCCVLRDVRINKAVRYSLFRATFHTPCYVSTPLVYISALAYLTAISREVPNTHSSLLPPYSCKCVFDVGWDQYISYRPIYRYCFGVPICLFLSSAHPFIYLYFLLMFLFYVYNVFTCFTPKDFCAIYTECDSSIYLYSSRHGPGDETWVLKA